MAKIVKKCQRSGKEFSAKGPAQKWCGTCPECREAAAEKTPAPKKKPAKPQAQAEETPRPKRATGFSRARSTPSASGIDLSGAIGKIEEQIAALDAQRERLLGAIESLRAIEAA